MSLADVLTTGLIRVTDRMTECGVAPVEVLGFGVDKAGSRALDVLAWVEDLMPFEVRTSKSMKQLNRAAFELGVEVGRAGYRPKPEPRHLRSV